MLKNLIKITHYLPRGMIVLGSFHILILSIFFIYRFLFFSFYAEVFLYDNLRLYFYLFLTSIRIDLIVSSYLSLPILFTFFLPFIGNNAKRYLNALNSYVIMVISFIVIFLSINIEWFEEFNNHMNIMFLKYGVGGKEGWLLVLEEYNLILYLLIWIATIYLSFIFYQYLIKNNSQNNNNIFYKRLIIFMISLILTIILIRGGFQQRPLDWGYANFSNVNILNETAQNPLFFFGRSIIEMKTETKFKNFLEFESLDELNNQYLTLRDINSKDNNFDYKNINKPNIIIIILESFVSENCNFLNPNLKENITPFLSSLNNKSISFSNCFANGIRSAYGISSILTSYPVLPGLPLISQVEASNSTSIIHRPMNIFSQLGYKRIFLYGGDSNFDNLKGFCISNGFDEVIDWKHQNLSNNKSDGTMWGYYDHIVMEEIINQADLNQESPFLITFFSTTNHDPFKVPIQYENKVNKIKTGKKKFQRAKKTMAYNDLALKDFFKKIKNKAWFDNTIFIITADHGLTVHRGIPNHPRNGHIPFMIYSDLIKSALKIDKVVSQIDIIPTIFDIINKDDYLDEFYGISGLKSGPGFACRIFNHNLQWITQNNLYYETMGDDYGKHLNFDNIWDDLSSLSINLDYNTFKKISNNYIKNAYYKFKKSN